MNIKTFHSNQKEMEQFSNEIKYWCNGVGELHNQGVSISVDDLPSELQRAYKDLWTDEFGSLCYLVETPQGCGVALLNEYDECFSKDCRLTMDELFQSVLKDSEIISKRSEFQSADIYIGEHSGFCECHELIVVFPASFPVEDFKTAAALLDELAYQSAAHHKPSLDAQIQSTSTRATAAHFVDKAPTKESAPER